MWRQRYNKFSITAKKRKNQEKPKSPKTAKTKTNTKPPKRIKTKKKISPYNPL